MSTLDQSGTVHISDASISVELETPGMTLNIGPQHPSTHGVLRLVAQVDGERVSSLEPMIGYMHRGYEKLVEVRNYAQIITLINRIDWTAGYANEVPFVVAVERLTEIEAPDRAQYIRVILTEMTRISAHLLFLSSFPLELGASTPLMYAVRDREYVLELLESVTGGRFHPNFNRVGGVKPVAGGGSTTKKQSQDLPAGFIAATNAMVKRLRGTCVTFDGLVTGNEVFLARTKGVGIITPDHVHQYGISGPNARASGVGFDVRKHEAYLPYDKFDFAIPTETDGDCFSRYAVRLAEIRESLKIIEQAVNDLPGGPLRSKVPRILKVPAGEIYVRGENPKGEMGYYIVSEGGRIPYRVKIRTASYSNLAVLPELMNGALLPDLVAILGSLDFVLGDVDR
ncbi:MAG: NADH-quinone oxidoreductase subunit D [Actinobacteria bacterium]|nr:NADH-quinone oxidoreductase subunit D [Actinomycetota bacterium]